MCVRGGGGEEGQRSGGANRDREPDISDHRLCPANTGRWREIAKRLNAKSDSKYEVVSGKRGMYEGGMVYNERELGRQNTHAQKALRSETKHARTKALRSETTLCPTATPTRPHPQHNTDTDTPIEERGEVSSEDKLSAPSPSDSTTLRKSEEGYINIVVH